MSGRRTAAELDIPIYGQENARVRGLHDASMLAGSLQLRGPAFKRADPLFIEA